MGKYFILLLVFCCQTTYCQTNIYKFNELNDVNFSNDFESKIDSMKSKYFSDSLYFLDKQNKESILKMFNNLVNQKNNFLPNNLYLIKNVGFKLNGTLFDIYEISFKNESLSKKFWIDFISKMKGKSTLVYEKPIFYEAVISENVITYFLFDFSPNRGEIRNIIKFWYNNSEKLNAFPPLKLN